MERYPEPYDPDEDDDEASNSGLAFSAYHRAWTTRQTTGDPSDRLLVAELEKARVEDVQPGSLLRETLWESWEKNRGPRRMHLTIARYRARALARVPGEIVDIFRDDTPEHLRIPDDLVKVSSWGGCADDEVELALEPSSLLQARLPRWYAELPDDEDGSRWREVPVWLDPTEAPGRARVLVHRDVVGTTTIGVAEHRILQTATRRGRRVVADGVLDFKRRKDGTFKVAGLSEMSLPDPED